MRVERFKELAFPKLIEATGDKRAPEKLNSAYSAVMTLNQMLGQRADGEVVKVYAQRLLGDFPDYELNIQAGSAEFLMAVLSMAASCIERYTLDTSGLL